MNLSLSHSFSGKGHHAMVSGTDDKLYVWGRNDAGTLGLGSKDPKFTPEVLHFDVELTEVACGSQHTLALAGGVFAWGCNKFGQLGLGHTEDTTAPEKIDSLLSVTSVACGSDFSVCCDTEGKVYAWGANNLNQLGTGDTNNRSTPQQIPIPGHVISVACGVHHAFAICEDETLYAWGLNLSGQCGLGETASVGTQIPTPQKVPLDNVIRVACGHTHTLALTSDGTLYAWGDNTEGALGLEVLHAFLPVKVLEGVTAIACGGSHSMALMGGSIMVWGQGDVGQLGLGDNEIRRTPQPLSLPSNDLVETIGCTSSSSFALTDSGSLYVWGDGQFGCLGLGEPLESKAIPQLLPGITFKTSNAVSISKPSTKWREGDIVYWEKTKDDGTKRYDIAKILRIDPSVDGEVYCYHISICNSTTEKPTQDKIHELRTLVMHAPLGSIDGAQLLCHGELKEEDLEGFFCYLRQTNFRRYVEEAKVDVEELLSRSNALYKEGNALSDAKEFIEAVDKYLEAFDIFPLFYEALDNAAFAYMDLGRWTDAIRLFKQSLEVEEENDKALHSIGECYWRLKEYNKAIPYLKRASEMVPQRQSTRTLLEVCKTLADPNDV